MKHVLKLVWQVAVEAVVWVREFFLYLVATLALVALTSGTVVMLARLMQQALE